MSKYYECKSKTCNENCIVIISNKIFHVPDSGIFDDCESDWIEIFHKMSLSRQY